MTYSRTQIGHIMIILSVLCCLYFYMMVKMGNGFNAEIYWIFAAIIFSILSFAWLTVTIDQQYLRIRFGYGLFFKRFLLSDIQQVSIVKNRWYHGWGIHYWMPGKFWIFNVSGFDAIELTMNNGKKYRIGTDEPTTVKMAIEQQRMNVPRSSDTSS